MTTYTLDTHATVRELEAAGMDSRQAEVVVAAISRSNAELATKVHFKAGSADRKGKIADLMAEIASVKSEVFRALWIQGTGLVGIQLAIAGCLFTAIRFLG